MAHATLTVWKFNASGGAQAASATLQQQAREQSVTVHDAATVSWEAGKKRPKTQQLTPTTTGAGALGGAFRGMLFGLIFFSDAVIDKVKNAFAGHQPDDPTFTHLSSEQEAALRTVLVED